MLGSTDLSGTLDLGAMPVSARAVLRVTGESPGAHLGASLAAASGTLLAGSPGAGDGTGAAYLLWDEQ